MWHQVSNKRDFYFFLVKVAAVGEARVYTQWSAEQLSGAILDCKHRK